MKLGGAELELETGAESKSILNARRIFLGHILQYQHATYRDLFRLFNSEYLRNDDQVEPELFGLFLLHIVSKEQWKTSIVTKSIDRKIRNVPVLIFSKLVLDKKAQIDRFCREHREEWRSQLPDSEKYAYRYALKKLIPDRKELETRPYAKGLYLSIDEWCKRHNLEEEWIFDFAIDCLRSFRSQINGLRFDEKSIKDPISLQFYTDRLESFAHTAWRTGMNGIILPTRDILASYAEVENPDLFSFPWMHNDGNERTKAFEIKGVFDVYFDTKDKFMSAMERELWSGFFNAFGSEQHQLYGQLDNTREQLVRFSSKLKSYIKKEVTRKRSKSRTPIEKRSNSKHFEWLVKYQLSKMSYSDIAASEGLDRKAVESGVKDVAKMLPLKLRKPSTGRPKGTKEQTARRRAR